MGENGAGKSTLMKILSGAYTADPGGEILIDGRLTAIDGPKSVSYTHLDVYKRQLSQWQNVQRQRLFGSWSK